MAVSSTCWKPFCSQILHTFMVFTSRNMSRCGRAGCDREAGFIPKLVVGSAICVVLGCLFALELLTPRPYMRNRAERDSGGGFFAGMVVGGAIFGALGYLFAPQISKALLSDDQRLKLPRFLEEEKKSPEATKQVRCCRTLVASFSVLTLHRWAQAAALPKGGEVA